MHSYAYTTQVRMYYYLIQSFLWVYRSQNCCNMIPAGNGLNCWSGIEILRLLSSTLASKGLHFSAHKSWQMRSGTVESRLHGDSDTQCNFLSPFLGTSVLYWLKLYAAWHWWDYRRNARLQLSWKRLKEDGDDVVCERDGRVTCSR